MDRNKTQMGELLNQCKSLSARRAWIEIRLWVCSAGSAWSLSARRAWIEMSEVENGFAGVLVALRKESVDRNLWAWMGGSSYECRSPQGERG